MSPSPATLSTTTAANTSPKGGAIYNTQSSPTLVNVTFSGNKLVGASGGSPKGGAMFNTVNSSPTLVNVTFSGNSAAGISEGGALYNEAGSNPVLNGVTFSGNTAHFGGALYSQTGTAPAIYNTVFWGDSSEIGLINSTPTIVDSLIQTGCPVGASCTNVIAGNPSLGPLQNNGGLTNTMALGPNSAALDAGGHNSTCPGTDQRNVARPQGVYCDMGAYEVRMVSFPSAPAYDGQVLELRKLSNIGGVINTTAPSIRVGDDALNRRYRGFLSFNTVLPPGRGHRGERLHLGRRRQPRRHPVPHPRRPRGRHAESLLWLGPNPGLLRLAGPCHRERGRLLRHHPDRRFSLLGGNPHSPRPPQGQQARSHPVPPALHYRALQQCARLPGLRERCPRRPQLFIYYNP